MANVMADVTDMLYQQIKRLNEADMDTVEQEVERAKGMEFLANGIRSNVAMALKVEEFRAEYGPNAGRLLNG